MSSKKSKTDLLVRQRFQNPLPAPAFPPKLLTIKTDPSRYASYDFLVPLFMERPIPMLVDAEGGMPLDQNLVPGYWDSKNQGRDGKMCPDINALDVELDDEDIALLVDPPGVNPANSGMMPSTSTASLDLIGNGRLNNQTGGTQALDRRKQMMPWLKRTDQAIAAQTSQAAQKQVTANQLAAQTSSQPAELTIEQQLEAITSTFSALETTPLDSLKHPTKAHLTAVESFDILPDETLWGNQYALFKFADNPFEGARLGGSETPLPAVHTGNMALFRPLETELDENGTNRIAYFLPDDDEASLKYGHKRRMGKGVDWDIVNEADETGEETAVVTEDDQHGFRFIRDYDAIRREVRSEYIVYLEEGENSTSAREKAAYYVPLTGHTLLRKRRARKGEPRNDYSDLGVEYWGGIEVTLGGKNVLPEDEVEGRKEDIHAIIKPPMHESEQAAVPVQQNGNANGHASVAEDSKMEES